MLPEIEASDIVALICVLVLCCCHRCRCCCHSDALMPLVHLNKSSTQCDTTQPGSCWWNNRTVKTNPKWPFILFSPNRDVTLSDCCRHSLSVLFHISAPLIQRQLQEIRGNSRNSQLHTRPWGLLFFPVGRTREKSSAWDETVVDLFVHVVTHSFIPSSLESMQISFPSNGEESTCAVFPPSGRRYRCTSCERSWMTSCRWNRWFGFFFPDFAQKVTASECVFVILAWW